MMELVDAASKGHIDRLNQIISRSKNAIPKFGEKALSIAAQYGHAECMNLIIKAHIDIVGSDTEGQSALLNRLNRILNSEKSVQQSCVLALVSAAQKGYVECINVLLKSNVDINGRDVEGQTALIAACYNGQVHCVKVLIMAGANVNMQQIKISFNYTYKGSPLIAAAETGRVECLELLLRAGADINLRDQCNKNALFAAASKGYVTCLHRLLCAPDIDCEGRDHEGNSVLARAARANQFDSMKVILEMSHFKGIDVNWTNCLGQNVLMIAAGMCHYKYVQLLLNFPNTNVNAIDRDGKSALVYAVDNRNINAVELLLRVRGINVDLKFISGYPVYKKCSLLFYACALWEPVIVLALLEAGARTGHLRNASRNPLMCMAAMGNIKYVKSLIRSSFSVTSFDDHSKSPLYYAAENGHCECLRVLIGALSENDRLNMNSKVGITKLFEDSAYNRNIFHCLPILLDAKIFSWSWYSRYYKPACRSLAKTLVTQGYSPDEFDYYGLTSTPLHHAFMIGDAGLIRYLMASLYLTSRDISDFHKDTYLHHHVTKNGDKEVITLHDNLYSKPWRLETLSFLKVSTLLPKDKRRQEVISNSDLKSLLPEKIQNRLAFKSHYQGLNVKEWDNIPINNLDVVGPPWPQENSDSGVVELEHVKNDLDFFHFNGFPCNSFHDTVVHYAILRDRLNDPLPRNDSSDSECNSELKISYHDCEV